MTNKPTIHIVGAGITGLAAAYYADKYATEAGVDINIRLLEASERVGGKLITFYRDGFVFEGGPDSFLTAKPWALELALELDVELIGTNDEQRNIFILKEGILYPMPDGLRLIVPVNEEAFMETQALSVAGRKRALAERDIPPRQANGDESMGSFVRRRFGDEMLEVFGEPMMAGIYVANADELSMQASFPRFLKMEREHGSLIKAMQSAQLNREATSATHPAGDKTSMFMTPKGGLQALIDALYAYLQQRPNVDVQLNHKVDVAPIPEEQSVTILTVPASSAANLVSADEHAELQQMLGVIEYSTTATISVAYRKADVDHPLDGFGFVVPKSEPTPLIACTWTSTKFDHRTDDDYVVLRAFVGEADVDKVDAELVSLVNSEIKRIMGLDAMPVSSQVYRWHKGSPIFKVGHLDRVAEMEALCPPNLLLAGASYRGVGIPDCVHQAQQAARKALNRLLS